MKYYRVMLGEEHRHARQCFEGGFVGADYAEKEDLSDFLTGA